MAKIQVRELHAVSASPAIPMDYSLNPFSVGFSVQKLGGGDLTYTIQHTFHELREDVSAVWFDHSQVSGRTASIDGNYAFPMAAMRLNVTAVSGSATAILRMIQAGI